MKYELKQFQANALAEMLEEAFEAQGKYENSGKPQVISLTAPTGSGKTIIATSFIEDVLMGNEAHIEHPDSIFVWLSDSPELNEQSKQKIERTADKLRLGQCVTIEAESFDQEYLDEGYIYFLNTQKLSRTSRLVRGGDGREYTIWETLQNTIEEKADRLFVIIDEAHRGMREGHMAQTATTTMQKFIKGSPEDGLSPAPVVIGMSATIARFNALVSTANSTIRPVNITPEEVRKSGLLKDEVIVLYPKDSTARVDMAVLQAATDDWMKKCVHWEMFNDKRKQKRVNPIFLIQVENGNNDRISNTDLDEVIKVIEDRIGTTFTDEEIVHAFSEKVTLTINGRTVRREDASYIDENRDIKVVLFKDSLSTGWDCPRAETMVSFRHATDATYIAQLLGRMLRTPLQQRVISDEYLNSVYLFLPYFNRSTVDGIVQELRNEEGGTLPTDVGSGEVGESDSLTARPPEPAVKRPTTGRQGQEENRPSSSYMDSPQTDAFRESGGIWNNSGDTARPAVLVGTTTDVSGHNAPQTPERTETEKPESFHRPDTGSGQDTRTPSPAPEPVMSKETTPAPKGDNIDRLAIIGYINKQGIQTYVVRRDKINDYLKSLFKLAGFLTQTGLYAKAVEDVKTQIADMIHAYIEGMKQDGSYDEAVDKIKEFTLSAQMFEVFGESEAKEIQTGLLSTTDTDIDRQFRVAEKKLTKEGVGMKYGQKYGDPSNYVGFKIDVILYVNNNDCMTGLMRYAESQYHHLVDVYRPRVRSLPDQQRAKYRSIVNDGDTVSSTDLYLPETIGRYPTSAGDTLYTNHLYVDPATRGVRFRLNGWESGLLEEEAKRKDFVCWLRNPDRKPWSLCIPYEKGGYNESMYPDFLVIRSNGRHDYFVDILEPHDPSRTDNVGKAKGLAKYAERDYVFGRIQLIRKIKKPAGGEGFMRLDMSRSEVRNRIKSISTNDELDHVFDDYGFFD